MSYGLDDYLAMIADPHRTGPYARALQRMVSSDSVVLDLGAGFGYFAVLAAMLGARHAYAIEPDDAIALGPALARANGVADRVTFIQGDSRDVELPERATLLIEDVRGVMPLHAARFDLLTDARARLLTADARCVAVRDHVVAAPARHPAEVRRSRQMLDAGIHGVQLETLLPFAAESSQRSRPRSSDLLAPGCRLGTLELTTRTDPHFEGFGAWQVEADAVVDGFVVWFESELDGGERFSAGPGPEQTVHGCLYLPLTAPLPAPRESTLRLRFCAVPVGTNYTWTWECGLERADGSTTHTPRQSSLSGLVLTPQRLRAMSETHRPTLGREGQRWRAAIALADGVRTTGEMAVALASESGLGFASEPAAFDWLQRAIGVLESGSATQL